jgi:EpsI family protein
MNNWAQNTMSKNFSYLVMLLFILGASVYIRHLAGAAENELVPAHTSLVEFPQQFDSWRQLDAQTLDADQFRELKAEDYISRTYTNDRGGVVYLFIAYYATQRHRQTIHSPQNCIPGSGWTMGEYRLHSLGPGQKGEGREINEYLIEKDGAKMLAFYWYHGRGRVVASDYWGRIYTVKDAMLLGRTDGALVRVIVPVGKGEESEKQARVSGLEFSGLLLERLSQYVPD